MKSAWSDFQMELHNGKLKTEILTYKYFKRKNVWLYGTRIAYTWDREEKKREKRNEQK